MHDQRPATINRVAAGLLAVIAMVHLQQYLDFMSEIPTIGVLFLLTSAGGAGLALALLQPDKLVRITAAVAGTVMAIAALVSIVIALTGHLFGYAEPSLRVPVVIAIIAEALALPALALVLARELRASAD